MTLEKAIEILEEEIAGMVKAGGGDWDDAILLGIEALKRVRDYKKAHIGLHYTPMPGETEE